ncbi:OLC1v1035120C1 [Oldenlandia corymbosa var. corymbosa]|uniref:OLC1v1035120C1 n=1 Tax=Oldenlandia corymbosa var. corymbosa TaxID=529605 RepID=A0AAV1CUU7_OLDCO|nr:OLC1v1035120C1 [Oldenlandia corymbosa var. corymbosa]
MGTKLQCALNPFSGTTSNNTFAVNQVTTDWRAPRPLERGVRQHSMDEIFDFQSHKKETIKKTMLMHEDIFQLQVKELHRLYDRQMKLMCELKRQKEYKCSPLGMKDANISQFTMWQKQMQDIRSNFPICGSTYDSGERSASCSGESQRIAKEAFYLERVAEQDQERPNCHRPLPGMPMNTGGSDEEIDVELTLSIGGTKSRKRPSSKERKICSLELEGLGSDSSRLQLSSNSVLMKIDTRDELCDNSPSLSSSSATQKQDKTISNWQFQDLSLNRT